MKHLLDTSALLAHFRSEAGAARVQNLFDGEDAEILLCSVSLAEMARRLRELGVTEIRIWRVASDYESLAEEVISVDAEVARKADDITRASRQRLPLVDALIGAAATTRQAVLVHRDAHLRGFSAELMPQLDLDAPGP